MWSLILHAAPGCFFDFSQRGRGSNRVESRVRSLESSSQACRLALLGVLGAFMSSPGSFSPIAQMLTSRRKGLGTKG